MLRRTVEIRYIGSDCYRLNVYESGGCVFTHLYTDGIMAVMKDYLAAIHSNETCAYWDNNELLDGTPIHDTSEDKPEALPWHVSELTTTELYTWVEGCQEWDYSTLSKLALRCGVEDMLEDPNISPDDVLEACHDKIYG